MKAARALIVLVLTVAGVGAAAPAFANNGGSATVCDTALVSVQPGGCVNVVEWGPRGVGYTFVSSEFCTGDQPLAPTVTDICYYAEIDSPYPMGAQVL